MGGVGHGGRVADAGLEVEGGNGSPQSDLLKPLSVGGLAGQNEMDAEAANARTQPEHGGDQEPQHRTGTPCSARAALTRISVSASPQGASGETRSGLFKQTSGRVHSRLLLAWPPMPDRGAP